MKEFWNQKYDTEDFLYGLEPNEFFAANIEPRFRGKLLLPGEGEGRNAFYAASIGWDVHAFDQSEVAAAKAMALARLNRFVFEYEINDCENFEIVKDYYDAIGLIYLHLPPNTRKKFHRQLVDNIKPGGLIIAELFSKKQIEMNSGGPKSPDMLYSLEDIEKDFSGMAIQVLEEKTVRLHEGKLHEGMASVIRFVGRREC